MSGNHCSPQSTYFYNIPTRIVGLNQVFSASFRLLIKRCLAWCCLGMCTERCDVRKVDIPNLLYKYIYDLTQI